jgi:hypothetical protein
MSYPRRRFVISIKPAGLLPAKTFSFLSKPSMSFRGKFRDLLNKAFARSELLFAGQTPPLADLSPSLAQRGLRRLLLIFRQMLKFRHLVKS